MAVPAAWILAVALPLTEASACTMGDEACPAILRMARGDVSITAEGFVSGERPNYYYEFDARAGQKMTVTVVGGNIKTGPGIPITLPNGKSDAVDENTPYTLPATGTYVILMPCQHHVGGAVWQIQYDADHQLTEGPAAPR